MNKIERKQIRKAQATGKAMDTSARANESRSAIHQWQKNHRAKQNYYTRKSNAKRFIQRDATLRDCEQVAKWTRSRMQGIKNGTVDTDKPWM